MCLDTKAPNVVFLMLVFLPLNFLAATQDIAVDGWALTILSRYVSNVFYHPEDRVSGKLILKNKRNFRDLFPTVGGVPILCSIGVR